ncbi:MAG: metal ABC transporter solute-binding protein, Zn/Mn family [Microthrixaceae bacterium]
MSSSAPRRTRTGIAAALVVLLSGAAAACGGSGGNGGGGDRAGAEAPVLATTSILADVTRQVACGRLDVPSVVPLGADAHEFQPTARDADRLLGASLVVANGLGLEEGLHDSLGSAADGGVDVLEVGPEVTPLTLDQEAERQDAAAGGGDGGDPGGGAGEGHGEGDGTDPHVWMDPDRMATAAGLISERLQRLDGLPVTPAEIRSCGEVYQEQLRSVGKEMEATLAAVPAGRRKLVTNHEALGYFADRFGFEVVGAVIPSTSSLGESNPRDLDELATTVRRAGVPAVFGETTQPTKLAEALAAQVGGQVRVVELFTESLGGPGSGAQNYVDMLRTDATLVAGALGGGG